MLCCAQIFPRKTYMKSIILQLQQHFELAIQSALGVSCSLDGTILPASRPEFGDYQANFAMKLGKQLAQAPRQVAEAVITQIKAPEFIQKLEVAGPGFINIRLNSAYCVKSLIHCLEQALLEPVACPQKIVVDYGGANVAKEMHVGHLRSTVIGDAIARLLMALGHSVIRQNHLGDFGTQFGMLVEYILEKNIEPNSIQEMSDLNRLYKSSKTYFDEHADFAERARARVVLLQAKDPETQAIWQVLVNKSVEHFQMIYDRLGVLLKQSDNRGESCYNDDLTPLVQELLQVGVAAHSEGAVVVFLEGYFNQEQQPLPLLIQKTDGGYLYATTDLAALRYRMHTLQADRIIYVTDARQKQHFMMVFDAARKAPWNQAATRLDHVPFGAVLGEDGKPFKTRSGESVRLAELMDEAIARALQVIQARDHDLSSNEQQTIAEAVGLGALKYADLASDRQKDYVFNWDRMLAFEGNTAPYLQNAYVRICSIFRKAELNYERFKVSRAELTEEKEHRLSLKILEFPDVMSSIAQDCLIHRLCHYLYDLASAFHAFYEHCPVLNAPEASVKETRLLLSAATAKVLKCGLGILGVVALDKM